MNGKSITTTCSNCGQPVTKPPSLLTHKHTFCNRDCWYDWHSKTATGWVNNRGYRGISVDGKFILEHRHIMEQHLGRKLETKEEIHHKNGNKTDNRLCNLELVTHAKHMDGHLFSEWDVQRAVMLLKQGWSQRRISRELGVNYNTLHSYLVKHGLHKTQKFHPPKWNFERAVVLLKEGNTIAEIGRQIGTNPLTIIAYFNRHGLRTPKKLTATKISPDNETLESGSSKK